MQTIRVQRIVETDEMIDFRSLGSRVDFALHPPEASAVIFERDETQEFLKANKQSFYEDFKSHGKTLCQSAGHTWSDMTEGAFEIHNGRIVCQGGLINDYISIRYAREADFNKGLGEEGETEESTPYPINVSGDGSRRPFKLKCKAKDAMNFAEWLLRDFGRAIDRLKK